MKTIDHTNEATTVATGIIERLEQAWNAGDGVAFAHDFAEDADFVNIRGEHHVSHPAIAAGHEAILATVYRGSTSRLELESARSVTAGVVVAVVRSTLQAPVGPLRGTHQSRFTMTIVDHDDRWQIEAFHNTLVDPGA